MLLNFLANNYFVKELKGSEVKSLNIYQSLPVNGVFVYYIIYASPTPPSSGFYSGSQLSLFFRNYSYNLSSNKNYSLLIGLSS